MESSLSGHWCGAGHRVSDGKVNEWNWQRGLIRARVNKVFQRVCMYVPCSVLKGEYIPLSLLAIVPYL